MDKGIQVWGGILQLLASPKFKKAYFRDEWDDLACLRVLGPDLSILEALKARSGGKEHREESTFRRVEESRGRIWLPRWGSSEQKPVPP